ncbi:MAG: prohibitin family protein [Candidatus Obscuribacterales bacterium]|nr:prohibitin family protein [Candidatus Obscuribacterales bacterium]
MNFRLILRIAGIVLGFVAFILILRTGTTVSTGHVGVASWFGDVQKKPLYSGFNFKNPLVSVTEVDTRLRAYHADAKGQSKDLQVVTTQVTVQYSQNPEMAPATLQQIGDAEKIEPAILNPAIQESVKAVTAKYDAEQLVTHRHEVKKQVEDALNEFIATTLKNKNIAGALDLGKVAITDFRFSEEFNHAIEDKVRTAQEALQAENKKTQTITEALAAKDARNHISDAEAYRTETIAKAKAKALELEGEALAKNPEVGKLRGIQQWDGKLPTFMGGQQPVPFISAQPAAEPVPPVQK